jgi:DNA-binding CsgD family transcriptional regulator/tetratricopeptide (TPR) repeat protein/energy-coupling factor transporter ATP-binding protein EcfA2
VPARGQPHLVGRADVLTAVEAWLDEGGGVVLSGPSGIGKTAILDALAGAAADRGTLVLRVDAAESERWLPFAGLTDLLGQVPAEALDALPGVQHGALDLMRRRGGRGRDTGGEPADRAVAGPDLAQCLAWRSVLEWCARRQTVLVVLDDAQWLDPASADVLSYAARRTGELPVRALVAQRWPDNGARRQPDYRRLCPPPAHELTVPPLDAYDLVELLGAYGLPSRAAHTLRADSGGNPYLALALGGAFTHRSTGGRPSPPLPDRIRGMLLERLEAHPASVRETLLVAAMLTRPTVSLLCSAGRHDAQREVAIAAQAGLVAADGDHIRFTPAALASVLLESATAHHRSGLHTRLSIVVPDPAERARHQALAGADPDAEVARSLVAAARAAEVRGARGLAAELYLLAADRTPPDLTTDRLDWLVGAAEAAAAGGRPELVTRAAEAVLAADADATHRVRARMAVIDTAGQALHELDEAFAAALADAGSSPALLAQIRLRLAWQSLIGGRREHAIDQCREAELLAERAGDRNTQAMACALQAQVMRVIGRPEWAATLDRALALPEPPPTGWLHLTPRHVAARFAYFDDRLADANLDLLRMLATLTPGGGEELSEVLRSLAEVAARAGRCRQALDYAQRALRVAEQTGLSPGPCWYTAALAELAGGDLTRGLSYAQRGVRASEEERDAIFVCRNLHALAEAKLRRGDTRGGVEALSRIRDLHAAQGVNDPSVLRWHSDLAAGLAWLGELTEAEAVIAAAAERVAVLGRSPGVSARLDRSAAIVLAERGDADAATALLAEVATRFAALGQPIEAGHTLLVAGQVERRRRRYAAARALVAQALAAFEAVDARPWAEQARRTLAPEGAPAGGPVGVTPTLAPRPAGRPAEAELTATEARIAALVREGASNREIAAQLFLSVKTVEATLTRIYRKLGVRSRTQLSVRLAAR